jgi:hypothetical protein
LKPLTFRDNRSGEVRSFGRIKGYEENLALAELGQDGRYFTDFHFNQIQQREQLYNMLGIGVRTS